MNGLTLVAQKFVLHWGEMGTLWGINRTVAQVHALLYLAPAPLHADAIVDTLGVARSNVSNSLKELQNWGVVRRVHVPDDRRDHFESLTDVWDLFLTVLDERKRREVDPTLAVLRQCVHTPSPDGAEDPHTTQRLKELLDFFETTTAWYSKIRTWSPKTIARVATLGDQALKHLGVPVNPPQPNKTSEKDPP